MVCCYVMAWFVSYGAGRHMPEYLYPGYNNALHLIHEKYSDIPGIYITKGDHLVINNCLFLSEQSDTYPMTYEKLPELPKILSAYRQSSHSGEENLSFLLYVDIYYPEEETAEEVRRLMGCQSVELLYDNTYTQIYLLN